MRTLYDSVTASDIPSTAEMVGGYIDGAYKWTVADWALFPNAVHVRIATSALTDDGDVLDVETGDATPLQSVGWVLVRRGAGVDPSVYCPAYMWPDVRAAFSHASVPEPHYWIAQWDNSPVLPDGAVAKQYANPNLTGGHYDASVVADYWPGVDDMTPAQVQAMIDASLAAYGQRLQAELDANYAPKQHPHTASATAPSVTVT